MHTCVFFLRFINTRFLIYLYMQLRSNVYSTGADQRTMGCLRISTGAMEMENGRTGKGLAVRTNWGDSMTIQQDKLRKYILYIYIYIAYIIVYAYSMPRIYIYV